MLSKKNQFFHGKLPGPRVGSGGVNKKVAGKVGSGSWGQLSGRMRRL